MHKIESYEYSTYNAETTIQLLSRLKSDCDYVLNFGGVRNLWGKTIDGHIGAMRFYWNSLKNKPDWLTLADIDDYETKLKAKFHESVEEKARHLVKIQVFFDGKDAFSFNYEGKVYVFHGDKTSLTKFLQSFKAKDNKTQPRSVRGERYADIAQEIIDQSDNIIYAWSNDLNNVVNKREAFEEAVNSRRSEVFVFSKPKTQNLFVDFLKKSDALFMIDMNKVFVDSVWTLDNMSAIADFIDEYGDDFIMYSPEEYTLLKRHGQVESISKLKEIDASAVEESIKFTAEGPVVSNENGKILSELFSMLDGDPRWEVDTEHRRCLKTDGSGYFEIKGNEILLRSGKNQAKITWIKNTKFLIMADGTVVVSFIDNNSEGKFEI